MILKYNNKFLKIKYGDWRMLTSSYRSIYEEIYEIHIISFACCTNCHKNALEFSNNNDDFILIDEQSKKLYPDEFKLIYSAHRIGGKHDINKVIETFKKNIKQFNDKDFTKNDFIFNNIVFNHSCEITKIYASISYKLPTQLKINKL